MEFWVGKYLEDQDVDLEYNRMPETPVQSTGDQIAVISSRSAPQPDYVQGFDSDSCGIQFRIRGTNSLQVQALAIDIHRKLTGLGDLAVTFQSETRTIRSVSTVRYPAQLEIDDKGRIIFESLYAVMANIGNNLYRKDTITT